MDIRSATSEDVSLIFSFIQKKATFDRNLGAFSGELKASEAKIRQTMFGTTPFAHVIFAELDNQAIGFALYQFHYSSFAGQPSIWIDDLYVDDNQRSQGAGTLLMNALVQIAKEHDCTHLSWNADARNTRGLQFYDRIGATITEQTGTRCLLTWIPFQLR
mgnify:CR=1 FL=1